MQVRERLLDPYFHQWLRDTEELLEKLPWSLEAPEQSLALSLTFERWLLQLKVWLALSPEMRELCGGSLMCSHAVYKRTHYRLFF